MPRNYPPRPDYSGNGSAAERLVWESLQGLPDDVAVFAQVRVQDQRRVTREADFLVAWPGVGVAIIEVKGGAVWSQDAEWFSEDSRGEVHEIKDPLLQAAKVGYALRDFAIGQGAAWPQWTPMVVLPATRVHPSYATPASRPEQWVGRDDLPALPARVEGAVFDELASPTFDAYAVESLVRLLEHDLPRPRPHDAAEAALAHADLITRDQYAILRALRTNDRITVTGGPGTGKTWLALEHARQETLRGAHVGVLCFNRALATAMRSAAAGWPRQQRPPFIGTLHQLALAWSGEPVPDPVPDGFWDSLPQRLADAAATRSPEDRFDLVVVDEGQDYRGSWWPAVAATLSDPADGPLVVFRDDEQSLYAGAPVPWRAAEVELSENVRNTQQIAAALAALPGSSGGCRGIEGPLPELIATPLDDVLAVADAAVDRLLTEDGWLPGDIALLTTWGRHPRQRSLVAELGPQGYSDVLASDEQLAVATVMSFKGLERPVVVLAVNGFRDPHAAGDVLRVGMSRPTLRLVVVADPHQLRQLGGDALLAALTPR